MTDEVPSVRCLSGSTPIQLSQDNICNPGFYCPNNTQSDPPEYCPPTESCQYIRSQASRNVCPGPQGVFEPSLCPPGKYCPNRGKELLQCPVHHYCPEGTLQPIKCTSVSVCRSGSFREFDLTGIVLIVIIDVALCFLSWWLQRRLKCRSASSRLNRCEEDARAANVVCADGEQDDDFASLNARELVVSMSKWSRDNLQGLTFEYSDLSYTIPRGNVEVLHSMSGIIQQETLHAIMGASGAGKSTFVDLVIGGKEPKTGSVQVNGAKMKSSDRKNYIGYVAQNDALLPELTVRETMMHSAGVRLPRLLSDAQRSQHVDRIIRCLGLEHVQHNIIGDFESHGLSGGEYKRASIGVELAAAPLALFLDEPTSGLDSTSALTLIRLLRKLTRAGMTIVVILHQPRKEIFNCLDSLTLLHQGRQMYQGSRDNVQSHFERLGYDFAGTSNTADLILDIISSEQKTLTSTNGEAKGEESTNDEFRATSRWTRRSNDVSNSGTKFLPLCRASWITQFWLCLVRSLKQQQRRAFSFYLEIGVGGIAGLIIGLSLYSYKGQHMQGIYLSPFERLSSSANPNTPAMIGLMVCMAIGLAASPSGVKTFGEENILRCKEASSGHSQSAYYLGKVVSTFPRLAISALQFTSFYTILATPRMTYWENFSIIVLYFYTIYGLASCCSFIVSRQDGPLMAVILCLIVSVLGGYGPSLYVVKQWHLEWLWRMFPGTWASEAYVDRTFRRSAYLYNINGAAQATGFSLGRYHLDISMIFILGSVYRVVAFGSMLVRKP